MAACKSFRAHPFITDNFTARPTVVGWLRGAGTFVEFARYRVEIKFLLHFSNLEISPYFPNVMIRKRNEKQPLFPCHRIPKPRNVNHFVKHPFLPRKAEFDKWKNVNWAFAPPDSHQMTSRMLIKATFQGNFISFAFDSLNSIERVFRHSE